MKKIIFLVTILSIIILSLPSCTPENNDDIINTPQSNPPNANFTVSSGSRIADVTSTAFNNTSTGDITSYSWRFEDGKGTSSSQNPSYTFDFEGAQNVRLTVTGPGGSDSFEQNLVVYAMDPDCPAFGSAIQSADVIQSIRNNNNVTIGDIRIINNYTDDLVIKLFTPDRWMSGIYNPKWTLDFAANTTSGIGNPPDGTRYSNEWGIRVQGANNVVSCVRNLGQISSSFSNGIYTIDLEKVLNGN